MASRTPRYRGRCVGRRDRTSVRHESGARSEDPDGVTVSDRIVCAPCAWFAADVGDARRDRVAVKERSALARLGSRLQRTPPSTNEWHGDEGFAAQRRAPAA